MLHRAALSAFAAACFTVLSGAAPPILEPLTLEGREVLRAQAEALTVAVRRRRPLPKGVYIPGREADMGNGWLAARHRVVTSSVLVAGWPAAPDDSVEVRDAAGRWHPAAVGLADASIGLAVLDVPGLASVSTSSAPGKDALFPGRPVFAVARPGAPLWRYEIGPRATAARAYYWHVLGNAPLGTPLVDAEGRVLTLVGLTSATEPGRAFVLPTEALRALFERSASWLP